MYAKAPICITSLCGIKYGSAVCVSAPNGHSDSKVLFQVKLIVVGDMGGSAKGAPQPCRRLGKFMILGYVQTVVVEWVTRGDKEIIVS